MKLRYRDRDGEIFVLRHAPRHHWWYFPHMTKDQAILLKALEDEYQLNHTASGAGVFDYQGSSITESAGDILSENDFPQN